LIFPRRGVTPNLLPTIDTCLNARNAVENGPNVEAEHRAAVGERRSGVVIDDVSDLLSRLWTAEDPVMSIEWRLGAIFERVRKSGDE